MTIFLKLQIFEGMPGHLLRHCCCSFFLRKCNDNKGHFNKCVDLNSILGYLKDSNAAAHSVDTGIS